MTKDILEITQRINEISEEAGYSNIEFVDAKLKLKDNLGNVINIFLHEWIKSDPSEVLG
ncbi:hypothetical protein [Methanobrevibacter curvatus]|uniref:Uncharacterized protein n=1 Tax=Methanobrevibacter curvatus TaxID=49547 RepID=A0A166CAT3_9EURY|nr:hypothetical protein [Methanobrevibacter curvatus]KZX14311.1 hypothetical protein MBCUR_05350 [Methanobrevibacter curvatus]